MTRLRRVDRAEEWERIVAALPGAHILQSWLWGEFKARYGWQAKRVVWEDEPAGRAPVPRAAAQILARTEQLGPIRAEVLYVPRGPLLDYADAGLRACVFRDLEREARESRSLQVKVDPELPLATGTPDASDELESPVGRATADHLRQRGWKWSSEQVQFRNTLVMDLEVGESALLERMKQKTRYNLRLAEKKGVRVRGGTPDDVSLLYGMYAITADRDGFVIRDRAYYEWAWGSFMQSGQAHALVAEVEAEPVAGLIVYRLGKRAWFMYGMSRDAHREKMPNYLLQWEAMRWARREGCTLYDLWGAPDSFSPSDPMWGVYLFKQGFGARTVRYIGAWDWSPRPALYRAYHLLLPRALAVMRLQARGRIRHARTIEPA